ncbi:MAG: glycerophosphodiester phosphodiesterase family protein [Acetivibrionales bacterium]|jgi:glycerophosphoryl diester phosphodiesterase
MYITKDKDKRFKFYIRRSYLLLISAVILVSSYMPVFGMESDENGTNQINIANRHLVAHGGGGINGISYTNSLEALNNNYEAGFRLFEIDIVWTGDEELVLLHDWEGHTVATFGTDKIFTLREFNSNIRIDGFTQMSINDLALWMKYYPDAYIITDIKERNIDALKIIKQRYPEITDRIIPQIYFFNEYEPVKGLGYENIILTLYKANYDDLSVIDFAQKNKLFAVTMPESRAYTYLPLVLDHKGVYTYVHTVNDNKKQNVLRNQFHVDGIYTDFIVPDHKVGIEDKSPSAWAVGEIEKAEGYGLVESVMLTGLKNRMSRDEFNSLAVNLYKKLTNRKPLKPFDRFVSNGGKGQDGYITVQEMIVALYETVKAARPKTDLDTLGELSFEDANQIEPWAQQQVLYFCEKKIIGGTGTKLYPRSTVSKEQAITLVNRVFEAFSE